ncbi:MAG: hypothetical protein EHM49_04305, partial [Deltaproteobacteria bacterium]
MKLKSLLITIVVLLILHNYSFAAGNKFDRFATDAETTAQLRDDVGLTPANIPYIMAAPGTISVFELDHNTETLNAARTILVTDKPIQYFDCNGADRDVTLPAEASSTDLVFTFVNTSDGAGENIVLKDDTPTTLVTIGPGCGARVSCDGTSWEVWNNQVVYCDLVNGYVGIGTVAPTADLDVTDLADNAEMFLVTYEAGSSKYSRLRLRKSHSNTLADVQTVLNEYLGIIQFEGQNTIPAFAPGSRIYARQSGTSGATVPSNLYLESSDEYSLFPYQFVVSDDRSVGINTKDPAAALDVVGALHTALTGTVSPTQTSATLEGVGTAFNTELEVGDAIRIPSDVSLMVAYEIFTVAGITDADTLTLDSVYTGGTTTGLIAYKDGDLLRLANGDGVQKLLVDKDGQVSSRFKTYEFSADAVTLTATHCLDTLITNRGWDGA